MRTVYKFALNLGEGTIQVPALSRFLHFADQNGVLTAWFELDTDTKSQVLRRYQIFGTGASIPRSAAWLGTCQQGPFVWHLYELDAYGYRGEKI